MLLFGLTGLRGEAFHDVTEQKTGALIETHHGPARVVGAGNQRQYRFEPS